MNYDGFLEEHLNQEIELSVNCDDDEFERTSRSWLRTLELKKHIEIQEY